MTEPLCQKINGAWTVLPYGQPVTREDGVQASYETVMSWPEDGEDRQAFGLVRPDPVGDPPAGKVEASRVIGGDARPAWAVSYVVAPDPLPARRAVLAAAVDTHRDALLSGGFTVPASVSTALAGEVLQTRDADDRVNWLTSQAAYSAAVAAGQGATAGARFRTADNATVTLTFAQGLSALLAMAAWGAAVMARSWALKDAIAAATDAAALDAIDVTGGWPA